MSRYNTSFASYVVISLPDTTLFMNRMEKWMTHLCSKFFSAEGAGHVESDIVALPISPLAIVRNIWFWERTPPSSWFEPRGIPKL